MFVHSTVEYIYIYIYIYKRIGRWRFALAPI
jgi:hypothetical protein